jgi:putative transposase
MGRGSWSWIVPDGLWEIAKPLIPPSKVRPQRGGTQDTPVELATAEWIDWYCHRRLHGEIGHVPPAEYETSYYTELTKPQVTTTI